MAGVNKVILIGNLGKDPEVRHLESGSVVANLTLATTETYKDKNGNRVDNTEWHDLELWEGLAKVAEQYLKKGSSVYVEGKIKSDTWQDEQGNNRRKTKIRVVNLTMLGGKSEGNQEYNRPNPEPNNQTQPSSPEVKAADINNGSNDSTDDLPF